MAEVLLSPGVLARENDSSQVSSQPIEAGCAIVGPTVKGPVNIPTIVTSYSDYQNRFGTVVESGSNEYTYFTSVSAYNYFQQGGDSLLVTRVVSGSYTSATSSKIENSDTAVAGAKAAASFNYLVPAVNYGLNINTPTTNPMFISSSFSYNLPGADLYYYTGSQAGFVGKVNEIIGSSGTNEIIINEDGGAALSITASVAGILFNGSTVKSGSQNALLQGNGVTIATLAGGTASTFNSTLELETLAVGAIQNNTSTEGSRGQLASGTKDNVRWEVISPDTSSGTFSLLIRQGDDITSQKKVLETWTNLSLDPNASNYVSRVIGDQKQSVKTDGTTYYLQMEGLYANASRYVRVKSVNSKTLNYFDNAGDPKSQYTSSIPVAGSGSFGAALGIDFNNISANFNQNINATNTQGLIGSNYTTALNLLANKDEFQYNVLSIPGLYREDYASQISSMVNNCQFRGDSIAVIDGVAYDKSITAAKTQAAGVDSSYAAMYWPWLQTIDPDLGDQVWVPASAMMPGVFAYNDSVSEAWFAPAGLNRGGLSSVIRAERKLTNGNRDELYQANINPIATFPNTGVVVFGQKTLQKKASALDRVNVRRLLIALKGFISQIADNLVFEQNTIATRNNFLAQVNPYLESVQQRQGLYAFKVVMDDSNNTPDVIDRNQLIGQIYLQPTKTAEFIYLDFNVLPTGAVFPS
jgi:phage tail sheath protein FI